MHTGIDPNIDVILTSASSTASLVLRGLGDGSFEQVQGGPGRALRGTEPIDWIAGGQQELAAVDVETGKIMVLTQIEGLDPQPEVLSETTNTHEFVVDTHSPSDAIVYRSYCSVRRLTAESYLALHLSNERLCAFDHAPMLDGAAADPTVGFNKGDSFLFTTLGWWGQRTYVIPGAREQIAVFDPFGRDENTLLLLGDAAPTVVWRKDDRHPWLDCRANLEQLPAATRAVVGDLDGDGVDELALLTAQGSLSLWRVE